MRERRKVMTGRVVSDKMPKTVIVAVEERSSHPLYGKVITKVRRFKAHNVEPLAKAGDLVKIVESRPISREKRFRVAEIVQRGEVVEQIVEKELESLREKEAAERAARQEEQERRAAARLRELGGLEEEQVAAEAPAETGAETPKEAE
ncbi:MAG: 30S ribosomal protein S17 [Chloroflexi bacterium]|nr:30S ribosomal protein S17 [Chloroflexota bacterium]